MTPLPKRVSHHQLNIFRLLLAFFFLDLWLLAVGSLWQVQFSVCSWLFAFAPPPRTLCCCSLVFFPAATESTSVTILGWLGIGRWISQVKAAGKVRDGARRGEVRQPPKGKSKCFAVCAVWENFYFKVQKTPAECEKWLKQKARVKVKAREVYILYSGDFNCYAAAGAAAPTAYAQCHKSNVTRRWPKTYSDPESKLVK